MTLIKTKIGWGERERDRDRERERERRERERVIYILVAWQGHRGDPQYIL